MADSLTDFIEGQLGRKIGVRQPMPLARGRRAANKSGQTVDRRMSMSYCGCASAA